MSKEKSDAYELHRFFLNITNVFAYVVTELSLKLNCLLLFYCCFNVASHITKYTPISTATIVAPTGV